MPDQCPNCQAPTQPGDIYCANCGMSLARARAADPDIVPIPDGGGTVEPTSRPESRRPRWYRRPRVLIPLLITLLIALALGAAAFYINQTFETLNELSTPPVEISGAQLGGDERLRIDTGPAQDAVREAEARRDAVAEGGNSDVGEAGLVETENVAEVSNSTELAASTERDAAAPAATVPSPAGVSQTAQVAEAEADRSPGTEPAGTGDDIAEQRAPDSVRATNAEEPLPAGEPVSGTEDAATPGPEPDPGGAEPDAEIAVRAVEGDSYTFLMMGVDARPGEAIDIGVRPDSLFVVFLDGSEGSCRVLSIPRDTRVELPGYGQSKINHALGVGGVPYERLVVENLLGIELEHYGLVDFAGVEGIVDGIGGITTYNDEAFEIDGHRFPVGELELSGDEALAYSRYRGGADGDFGRQERQQAVIRAILAEGASVNLTREVPRLLSSVGDHVRTDLGVEDIIDIAQEFRDTCDGESLQTDRIDGTVANAYDELMQQELSFVLVEDAEVERKVSWLLTGEVPLGVAAETPASDGGTRGDP